MAPPPTIITIGGNNNNDSGNDKFYHQRSMMMAARQQVPNINCNNCKNVVSTIPKWNTSGQQWCCCISWFIFGGGLMSPIPFCVRDCYHFRHVCS